MDSTIASLLQYREQNKGLLPDGFKRVEYLESTGEQWIDTGVVPTNYYKPDIQIRCSIITSSQQALLAQQWCAANVLLEIDPRIIGLYYGYNGTTFSAVFGISDNESLLIRATKTSFTVNDKTVTFPEYDIDSSGILTLTLFACRNTKHACSAKVSSLTIGSAVSFLPALCTAGTTYIDGNTLQSVTVSADKPGMYDTVSGHFFVNQGTGADFLTGPEIEDTAENMGGGC